MGFGIPAGFLEEIGWTGYAFPNMCRRLSLLTAGILLGLLWGFGHLPVIDFLGTATAHGRYLFPYFLAFVAATARCSSRNGQCCDEGARDPDDDSGVFAASAKAQSYWQPEDVPRSRTCDSEQTGDCALPDPCMRAPAASTFRRSYSALLVFDEGTSALHSITEEDITRPIRYVRRCA